jgi:aquaporin Z
MALVGQLWLFWIAPIVGALAAGFLYNSFFEETLEERRIRE